MLSWLGRLTGQQSNDTQAASSAQASTSKLEPIAPPAAATPPAPAPAAAAPLAPTTTSYLQHDDEPTVHTPSPLLLPISAFFIGFFPATYTAARKAGLIFMAENAHRRPNTVQGWYFYNKTKNYKVILAGVKGGARTGLQLSILTGIYLAIEQGAAAVRTQLNLGLLSTDKAAGIEGALAGGSTAALLGTLYKLHKATARRTILLGLVGGAFAGSLKPLRNWAAERAEQAEREERKTVNAAVGAAKRP